MALTTWKSLSSEREIADLPAIGFRYKHASDIIIYLAGSPEAMAAAAVISWSAAGLGLVAPGLIVRQIPCSLKVHIETPQGERIFEQQVDLVYTFVAIIQAGFAGLMVMGLFTWWIGSETITTTICGHELEEGEEPQTLGAEQGRADPAGGSDYTAQYAHVMGDWISPLYLLNIPDGSTFHIDFHNFGLAHLTYSFAAIQTQVIPSMSVFYRNPREGMIWLARAGDPGMEVACWPAAQGELPMLVTANRRWASNVGTAGGRAVWVPYASGLPLALVWEGFGSLLYAESTNEGREGGWQGPVAILPGHRLLSACRDKAGTLYLLTRNGEGQVTAYPCHTSPDLAELIRLGAGVIRLGSGIPCLNITDGGPLSIAAANYLTVSEGVFTLLVDVGDGIDYYEGMNAMATWRRALRPEEEGGQ